MRPYLAIIKDSFREALSSRVLWILLFLSTLVLAAVAPFGVEGRAGVYFAPNDISNSRELFDRIKDQHESSAPSPGKQIWPLLSDAFRTSASESPPEASPWQGMIYYQLRDELNRVLDRRDLYDPTAWDRKTLSSEANAFVDRGVDQLDSDELPRLNRLLLEAAYPDLISPSRTESVTVNYLGYRLGEPIPLKKTLLIDSVINGFVQLFVGVVGVFAGILVTASIIPQTYTAGAIDLLLSKPVSRVLVFLTKYVGGCMFILINAGYVIFGLWLIAGLRMGHWSNKLLVCIPVFMFLFAIYYAVSALAGVIWRNAIICVVMSVLLWAACFGVGATKNVIETWLLGPQRIVKLTPAGADLMAANEQGKVFQWQPGSHEWSEIFSATEPSQPMMMGLGGPMLGPVYDAEHERLFAIPPAFGQFGLQSQALHVADRADHWKSKEGVAAPSGATALFVTPQHRVLVATPRGLFRLEGEPTEKPRKIKVLGFDLPVGARGSRFVTEGPTLRLGAPLSAAIDSASGAVALFDSIDLLLLRPDAKGRYEQSARRKVEGNLAGIVAIAGQTVVLGRSDGRISVFEGSELKPTQDFRPQGNSAPRFIESSADGRFFAVVFHNRKLWLYDAEQRSAGAAPVSGQGTISAAAFDGDQLLIADYFTRVTRYALPSGEVIERFQPSLSMLQTAYFYAVKPLYTVFPKPGEIDNVVTYLLNETDTAPIGNAPEDLRSQRVKVDVWGPIWSNLAFIAVVVGLGCWYTQRKDF